MEEAYQTIEYSNVQADKNLRGDPPYSQILIEFLLSEENFLPWNEKPYCFGKGAIK